LRKRLAAEPFKSAVCNAWRAASLEDFLAHYVGNADMARHMQDLDEAVPVNTDDRTVIEFALARSLSSTNVFQLATVRAAAHRAGCDRPKIAERDVDWQRVRESQLSTYSTLNMAEQKEAALTDDEKNRAAAFLNYNRGDVTAALQVWRAQSGEPQTLSQLALVAEGLATTGDANAPKYIDKLAEKLPLDAQAIRAEFFLHQGEVQRGVQTLKDFFRALQNNPWPEQDLIRRSLSRAERIVISGSSKDYARSFYDVLSQPFAVWNCEGYRLPRVLTFGLYLDGDKPGEYTALPLRACEPEVPWELRFLSIREACYRNMHSPRAQLAARDLDDFIQHQAFTSDAAALSRVFESSPTGGFATEMRPKPTSGR